LHGCPGSPCFTCHECGMWIETELRRRCAVCMKATYCGRSCQRNHWPTHKKICSKPSTGPEVDKTVKK
jgi:hypothetical protein